jgi:hypothetical protein
MTATARVSCPLCGFTSVEPMPANLCVYFYDCRGCGVVLRPKPGDCCVFCSHADAVCPPKQGGAAGESVRRA